MLTSSFRTARTGPIRVWVTGMAVLGLGAVAGCEVESECAPAELGAPAEAPAFAVVTSLFRESSAIALLGGTRALVTEAWLDSGTRSEGTRGATIQGLGGDVTLPTDPVPGELVVLERLGADRLTRLRLADGAVLGQHALDGERSSGSDAPSYRPNPQDAVRMDDGTFLVSRLEPNADPKAPTLAQGNDLLLLDGTTGEITGRVAFAALGATVRVGDEDVEIFARPSRMTRRGDRVVVGLAGLDRSFRVAGPGAVAVLDWPSRTLQRVTLGGLSNCGVVAPVPGTEALAAVLCAGDTFQDAEGRRPGSGVALVDTASSTPTVTHVFRAADHPDVPPPQLGLVALDARRVAYLSLTLDDDRADALVLLDVPSGETKELGRYPLLGDDALLGFNLGPGTWVPEDGVLLVPSATEGALCFDVGEGLTAVPMATVDVSPCRSLPARGIVRLVP